MKIWKENPKNGRTGGCILLENGRGLKNQGGLGKILEKEKVFGIWDILAAIGIADSIALGNGLDGDASCSGEVT
ncbi:hypothetical protein EHQ05_08385 [Leptospira yasudae]|uniref:hypothetical protein n=1 Tax=Leptospira yasudae TaxID=2202201 RepID=UPI001082DF19|nr:hypothetical protein [Leptospira yasudae]TGK27795.1 hypothetical protein EHQ05_08385 [Leptospira yasudae]TGM06920.1 hypothetical protein EHQ86_08440 [Leptospira yasudae]